MLSDLREAMRSLGRDWSATALAVALLALTGGATAAVFTVVHAVILVPPQLAHPDRTVVMWQHDIPRGTPVVEVARGEVEAWRARSGALEAAAVYTSVSEPMAIVGPSGRTGVASTWVSASFFDITGIAPAFGRVLDDADEIGTRMRTVVVSHGFWHRHFGGDPGVIGRTVRLQRGDAGPDLVEVAGVMPEGFDFPPGTEAWVPAAPILRAIAKPDPNDPADVAWYLDHFKVFHGLGRLRAGVSMEAARRDLDAIVRQQEVPTGQPSGVVLTPVVDYLLGPVQPVLWTMLGGGLLMVALVCASVGGLQLFRAARQDRALAVHLALGASRWRLVRRSLLETAGIIAAGSLGSLIVASWLTTALVAAAPVGISRLDAARTTSATVLLAMLAVAGVAAAITSVAPAMLVGRVSVAPILIAGSRAALHPRERLLQRLVVGSQIAVAVVLLTGASLFVRSVRHLDRTPLGFDPHGLMSVELLPSDSAPEAWDRVVGAVTARVGALPHVDDVAAIARRPLSGPIGNDTQPVLKGQEGLGPDAAWRRNPRVNLQSATPGYFRTAGIRLLAGRDFVEADVAASPNVVIVGRSAAARLWPGRDPLGAQIVVATQRQPGTLEPLRWQTVVGVADDVRYRGIRDPRLDVYLPALQSTLRVRHLMVRGAGTAARVIDEVRDIARAVDPGVLIGEAVAMEQELARETAPWRFAMRVLVGLGGTAAVVAATGLTGLLSLVVTLRRRELGIRASLGATPARLRGHVLHETMRVGVAAAAVGGAVALAGGRLITGLLVEVAPHDAISMTVAIVVTLMLSVAASLVPAAQAARSDPSTILRD